MISPQYKAYVDSTIALTRTLCIKSEHTLRAQNDRLLSLGHTVLEDPMTWRYYLNLAGLYHSTDPHITITSSDTLTEITLSPGIWDAHPLSYIEYGSGGQYHRELLARYPEQRQLILRIFNPVDMETAIAAADFTILYVEGTYIHPREISLRCNLQEWVYGFRDRWDNLSFAVSDGYYAAAMLAVMYHNIPLAIIGMRLAKCHTVEVAEFHLWAFLGSRYRLDRYRGCLDNGQSLYLYRNIDYLRFHVGKERTMIDLQTHITEPRDIIGHRFDISQSDSVLITGREASPLLLKTPYKAGMAELGLVNRVEVAEGYELSKPAAHYNPEDVDRDVIRAADSISSSVVDTLPTGLVSMDTVTSPIDSILNVNIMTIHHALYLASENHYITIHSIDGGPLGTVTLSTKNMVILLTYCYNLLSGGDLESSMVDIRLSNIRRQETISKQTIEMVMTADMIDSNLSTLIADALVSVSHISSLVELITLVNSIAYSYFLIDTKRSNVYLPLEQSIIDSILGLIFREYLAAPGSSWNNYQDWISTVGISDVDLTPTEILTLVDNIIETLTGIRRGDSISKCGATAVEVLKLLTSYGIVFVTGDGPKPLMRYQYPTLLPNRWDIRLTERYLIDFGVYGHDTYSAVTIGASMDMTPLQLTASGVSELSHTLDQGLTITEISAHRNHYNIELPYVGPGRATSTLT